MNTTWLSDPVFHVFLAGFISMMATGLGAIPLLFIRREARSVISLMYAAAVGFMVSASVFSIAAEGLHLGTPWEVAIGFVAGGLFMAALVKYLPQGPGTEHKVGRRSRLMLLALFAHSVPEGIAIGVGFATGEVAFGLTLAIAISVHNIPEGTAMSLPLRDEGVGFWRCFWTSVFTSLPQALFAVPAFLFVQWFDVLLPVSLAFAGGAMIYLVVYDLLPEAFEGTKNRAGVAWSFLLGLTVIMLLTAFLDSVSLVG